MESPEQTRTIIQLEPSGTAQVPCPICGVYFNSAEGLHQHLHHKHAHVEQAAKISFDRSKHSLFGLPFCRFCRTRKQDWQSLTKHVTQGACLRLKTAFAQNQTIDQLLDEIQAEEQRDPPQHPAGNNNSYTQNIEASPIRTMAVSTPLAELRQHSRLLVDSASQCILCGQRLLQASRIKSHWQQSHAQAWKQSGRHAITEAGSLSALFESPCVYCGSKAKNYKQHASQCPVMFQILALRRLTHTGEIETVDDSKPAAPRKHEAQPKYKSFVSPLKRALEQGARASGVTSTVVSSDTTASVVRPKPSSEAQVLSSTNAAQVQMPPKQIHPLFRRGTQTSTASTPTELHWTCRLRLSNPQSLCYANAATLALLSAALIISPALEVPKLEFLYKVGKKAAEAMKNLSLSRMHQFRQLTPQWMFSAEQKDTAEYLQAIFAAVDTLQVTWDTRSSTTDGVRLRVSGTQPLLVPIADDTPMRVGLQELINAWHSADGDTTGLTHPADLVCVQVGRYHPGGKRLHSIAMPEEIRLPCFSATSETQWWRYQVCSAIIHLGRSPLYGHYRALLRCASAWHLADDSKDAVPVTLHAGHLRNIYVIMLRKVDAALPSDAAHPLC